MSPQIGPTHYADYETLSRLRELEQENERLRALLQRSAGALEARAEMLKVAGLWHPQPDVIANEIRAALGEEKR